MRPGIGAAFEKAIDEMPEGFLIKRFIMSNRAEVKDMCLTEYNEAEAMELFREEGREEGRQEGREEGRQEGREEGRQEGREEGKENTIIQNLNSLMQNLKLTIEQAMDAISIPDNKRAYYRGLIGQAKGK